MREEGRKDKKGDRYEEVGSYFDDLKNFFWKKLRPSKLLSWLSDRLRSKHPKIPHGYRKDIMSQFHLPHGVHVNEDRGLLGCYVV